MSKERLERIKERVNYHGHLDDDVEWLIEQAERVEELEEERDEWKDTAQSYYMTNQELREQNKRYREALELLVKQETIGKDVKTEKTAISYNGMIALKGLGVFNDDNYIVYGLDEIIESVLEESK